VNGRLVRREALLPAEREAMLALLSAHFAGVTRDSFERDLAEKSWVVLLEEEGRLRGFTTLLLYPSQRPSGEPISVVYSGDTIVERGAWGSAALPKSWIAAVRALHAAAPAGPLYWLLLTSGFRTYRFLPVFWREFYPHPEAPTPPAARALLDALARERLGAGSPACRGRRSSPPTCRRCRRESSTIRTWPSSSAPTPAGRRATSWSV
jgi:hypothetical protein